MIELLLIRHGQPVRDVRTDGTPADPSLSELGRWQADRVAAWLQAEPIDVIVASPKARALQTAEPLAHRLGIEPTVRANLDEIDRLATTYFPTEELHTAGEYWDGIVAQEWDAIGWDSPEVFRRRVRQAFHDLLSENLGSRIAVFSHSGVMNRMLAAVVGQQERLSVDLDYACLCRVRLVGAQRHIKSINETAHFDAERPAAVGAMRDGSTGLRTEVKPTDEPLALSWLLA